MSVIAISVSEDDTILCIKTGRTAEGGFDGWNGDTVGALPGVGGGIGGSTAGAAIVLFFSSTTTTSTTSTTSTSTSTVYRQGKVGGAAGRTIGGR